MTFLLLPCGYRIVRMEVLAFLAPLVVRYLARGSVKHHVAGPVQPGDGLLVQIVKRGVGPVVKEVLLHILHAVLYLAFLM